MTVAERKKRDKERRRDEILNAAEEIFYAKGFDSATMDEIADLAEISKGSVYVYFKNKDSLFMQIVFRKWEEFGRYLSDCMGRGETGREKIKIMIRCFVDFAKHNREYNDLATTYGPSIMRRIDKEDTKTLQSIAERYLPLLMEAIHEGQQDGSIRRDLDSFTLGSLIHMITFFVVSPDPSWKQGYAKSGGDYDELVDLYPAFIEPALAGCPGPKKKTPTQRD